MVRAPGLNRGDEAEVNHYHEQKNSQPDQKGSLKLTPKLALQMKLRTDLSEQSDCHWIRNECQNTFESGEGAQGLLAIRLEAPRMGGLKSRRTTDW